MPKNATAQRPRPRQISQPRLTHAEIVTIAPRQALMQQLEAKASIFPVQVRVKATPGRAR